VRSARPTYTFTNATGQRRPYAVNAAAITVEKAEHLTLRNCVLHDSGNGLFISSNDKHVSRDILVTGNHIFGNGISKSGQEHNIYTAAIGLVFEYNRLGPLRTNCIGNNLKDRSAGLVVRYNWIEGGNKELDLVDAEDSALIRRDPAYSETLVYGNVFLKLPADLHSIVVHYGGDSPHPEHYRKGTLQFFHNTIVSYRRDTTVLFWLSSNAERCNFRNNIAHLVNPKAKLSLLRTGGILRLDQNWLPPVWKNSVSLTTDGVVTGAETGRSGAAPPVRRVVTSAWEAMWPGNTSRTNPARPARTTANPTLARLNSAVRPNPSATGRGIRG
jgi:hypothetical protein